MLPHTISWCALLAEVYLTLHVQFQWYPWPYVIAGFKKPCVDMIWQTIEVNATFTWDERESDPQKLEHCKSILILSKTYAVDNCTLTFTNSKGNLSWKIRLILAPPESSLVLISEPEPSMHLSKSWLNVVIILEDNKIPRFHYIWW